MSQEKETSNAAEASGPMLEQKVKWQLGGKEERGRKSLEAVGHRYYRCQKKSHTLSGKCWKHISRPAVQRASKTGNNLGINMNHENGIQHTEYKHNPWVHTELEKGAGGMRLDLLYKTMPANRRNDGTRKSLFCDYRSNNWLSKGSMDVNFQVKTWWETIFVKFQTTPQITSQKKWHLHWERPGQHRLPRTITLIT